MEENYLFLFGNTPELSLKELESFFTNCKIKADLTPHFLYALVKTSVFDSRAVLNQLGGTVKIAMVLGLDYNHTKLQELIFRKLNKIGQKVIFGISSPDKSLSLQTLHTLKTEIKRKMTLMQKSVRFVDSVEARDLSSVVIEKEKVVEFLLVRKDNKFILSQTAAVQDYEYWSRADFGRPYADPQRGMLAPKIARIMVNLSQKSPCGSEAKRILLDPFCGMGTVLQEGLARGFEVIGNDFSSEVIDKTRKNLEWYEKEFKSAKNFSLFMVDAVHLSQLPLPKVDCIVSEGYLGPTLEVYQQEVFTSGRQKKLSSERLKNIYRGLEKLYIGSLREWKKVLKKDGRIVMIFPSFRLPKIALDPVRMIDKIRDLGYSISCGPLAYSRPGASVVRNIYRFNNLP